MLLQDGPSLTHYNSAKKKIVAEFFCFAMYGEYEHSVTFYYKIHTQNEGINMSQIQLAVLAQLL